MNVFIILFNSSSIRFAQENLLSDWSCDLTLQLPGVYEFIVEYKDLITQKRIFAQEKTTFLVDPRLYLPPSQLLDPSYSLGQKNLLPLDGICLLTIIPKWMPSFISLDALFQCI